MGLLILAVLTAFGLNDATSEARPLVKKLEARYKTAQTLSATFLQRYSEDRRTAEVESGHVFFNRPGRMRWEYEAPERKLFISDGKLVWFYVPSERTVTRTKVMESADWRSPLALLTRKVNLARLCARIELLPNNVRHPAGHAVLRCYPRGEIEPSRPNSLDARESPDAGFLEVLLEVNETSGELERFLVRQPGGVELEYRFANWLFNPPLQESLFHFAPAAGVAIVEAPSDRGASASR